MKDYLKSGIYKKGAGLGQAMAFLYSGPAINVLAIILGDRIWVMLMLVSAYRKTQCLS